MNVIYLNGQFMPKQKASISVLDRGFLFGDGVYEVIPVFCKKPVGLNLHLERLQRSLQAIHIQLPRFTQQSISIFKELILLNHLEDKNFSFYIQITRGVSTERLHEFTLDLTPTVMVCCKSLPQYSNEVLQKGFKAILMPDHRRQECYVKSINLLPNVLAYQKAKEVGAIEAILIKEGYAVEASSSNLFIVKDNTLITPPLSPKILAGVTRQIIIQLAKENHIPVIERNIKENELYDADEIWVTGSSKEICPITRIEGHSINAKKVGPLWYTINQLYQAYKQTEQPLW
jgi:D-alanine transaminase